MKMTFLHTLTFVLTILWFVVRHRYVLAVIYSGKWRNIRQQGSQHDSSEKSLVESDVAVPAAVELRLFLSTPKYKRDPEIDVDSEEIGYEPLL